MSFVDVVMIVTGGLLASFPSDKWDRRTGLAFLALGTISAGWGLL